MALDPEEIDFDSETMALKAEAALRYRIRTGSVFSFLIFFWHDPLLNEQVKNREYVSRGVVTNNKLGTVDKN